MIARLPAASLPWLVAHDIRLRSRSRETGVGRLIAIALLALLPLLGGVGAAIWWRNWPAMPMDRLGITGAMLLIMALVMVSSGFAHVQRSLRDRGDLDLLLAAPLPPSRVLAARAVGVTAVVALPFLILTTPFFVTSALLGHPWWLAGIAVVAAIAMVASALAWLLADGLDRALGPARARVVAQVTGVFLGAGAFAVGQLPNFAPERYEAIKHMLAASPPPPLLWLGAALFGMPGPLLALIVAAMLMARVASDVAARSLMAGAAVATSGDAADRTAARRTRFATGTARVLIGKELRLIGRDPELISQIGQQLVFLVPVLAVIFTGGSITAARMAAAGVFVAGALASSLAWLILCAEDAPDLIGAAPVAPRTVIMAKLAAALLPPLLLVGSFAAAVAFREPRAALVMLPMALAAGLATALMQYWTAKPAGRSAFRNRHRSSLLMAVGEFLVLGCFSAITALLLAGNWWALAPAAFVALILLAVWLFRRKD